MFDVKYPVILKPIPEGEGGGYLVEYPPDLPGCMADGETVEEALKEGEDALNAWLRSAEQDGEAVPEPSSLHKYSGQWRIRVPKSLHAQLDRKAKQEGVSLNMLAVTLLAEGLGRKSMVRSIRH